MIQRVWPTSPDDDPYKACAVEVTGTNRTEMIIEAKREAAWFLHEPFADLRASDSGNAQVRAYERFVPHEGVRRQPISWSMTVSVKLNPEIVKARREALRDRDAGEHPVDPDEE